MLKSNNPKMHTLSEIGPNVPAFLIKLWKLVNSPETDSIICWSESGLSFLILNQAQFSRKLLSLYYKHNNMASFIRQLNMYGFHKIVSDGGGLKNDSLRSKYKDCMEFAHQYFIRDHIYLLENIKRKLPNPKSGVILNEQLNNTNLKNGTQSEILSKVLSDINNLKGKQESWDTRLASMKRENEALWRELAVFRQKHLKQEQIINRLIHFIVTIVQPSRNVPLRRRYPLMLNDIQPVKKITKLSNADATNLNQGSPTGPTIHEIDSADVIFGSPKDPEISTTSDEFISSNLPESSPKFVEVENPEPASTEKEVKIKPSVEIAENIPEDWLEIQLTEDDVIDPLTPIDPAKVNPAVAAATLKHFEGTNKIVSPIAITIPSVILTEPGKKNKINEKKIIHLTNINDFDKFAKKKKKPIVLKLNNINSKSNLGTTSGSLLQTVPKKAENSVLAIKQAGKPMKRKLSNSNQSTTPVNIDQVLKKAAKKDDSHICVPEVEIDDDLDFLLTTKKLEDNIAGLKESEKVNGTSSDQTSVDSFLKLEDLYNETINEDPVITSSENPTELVKPDSVQVSVDNKLQSSSLTDAKGLVSEVETETTDTDLHLEPHSMAVVCQQSGNVESLARDLNSHVESVQGELDYLKEMLKGEGYNFDTNSLPWLFNDDLLSYGVMPSVDEEGEEKKNEEAVSGNELMSYGAPNLMDLVDVIGSSASNQDWNLSPTSPVVTDLTTPAPSPSTFSFPTPNKRR